MNKSTLTPLDNTNADKSACYQSQSNSYQGHLNDRWCKKNALGQNIPSQQTIISKNHGILYNGSLRPAKSFIGKFENVYKIKYTGETLYNVLMEKHDKMMVNNLICETLHPENSTAQIFIALQKLNPEEQRELIEAVNEYIVTNNVYKLSSAKITDFVLVSTSHQPLIDSYVCLLK